MPLDHAAAKLDAAELGLYEREARVVSQQIVQLVTGQSAEPRDIVILARTRAIVRLYAAALREKSIPVSEDTGRTMFDHPDLRLIHALLMTMDNPRQDIPLAAVLKSGLLCSAFAPHELLTIRTTHSKPSYLADFSTRLSSGITNTGQTLSCETG